MICSDASSLCILCSGCDDALSPTLTFHFNLCPWDLGVCFPPAKSQDTKFQQSCPSYPFLSCQTLNLHSWLEIPGLLSLSNHRFPRFCVPDAMLALYCHFVAHSLHFSNITLVFSPLTVLTSAACYHTHCIGDLPKPHGEGCNTLLWHYLSFLCCPCRVKPLLVTLVYIHVG